MYRRPRDGSWSLAMADAWRCPTCRLRATGATGQTIDKATGIVTSSPSTLPPYTPNSVTSVTLETIVMDNNRVTPSSVIVASIVQNCNPDTLLTVVQTTPIMGQVTFKVANVGAAACASETFQLAFVVLTA